MAAIVLTLNESWSAQDIVRDLTKVLDFLDDHASLLSLGDMHRHIVSELSICLVKRNNVMLLPYVLAIDRYGNDPQKTIDMIECIYMRHRRL
jgi:hypothetical protein